MEALVLVIDDDEHIGEVLRISLENEQFNVVIAKNGLEGLEKFHELNPELVILDIMLPGQNGWEVCKEIRKTSNTPILMLTAKGEELDRVLGLELGADDYVLKPFSPRELVARVRAILRRTSLPSPSHNTLRFADLYMDLEGHTVKVGQEEISLTPKEFELLAHLAQSPGRVFTREQLLTAVWGYDYLGDVRTVDEHIKRIRQKVEAKSAGRFIKTVWGLGYKFKVEE